MKILPVVLISVTFFISAALASDESCYLTEDQEDECAAVCHPIVKPLLRYFEKIQAKESQLQNDYSELQKKYTDLEKKGQEHNGQISQFQKNYSDLQKKYSDFQERELEKYDQILQFQKDKWDFQAQIDAKNVEIKLLKDQISELNKTNELATKILRDDIAKLGEIVKNINSVNRTASPSPTRTVQQLPQPSKDRCPQSQNEMRILQEIQIPRLDPFVVICFSTNQIGSGWMVVYRKVNEDISFNRTYEEYVRGFGNSRNGSEANYFIGLERLHLLTNRNSYELFIGFGHSCDNIVVGNRSESYMVKDAKGCTGHILQNFGQVIPFSTWDRDQDGYRDRNLAKEYGYGFWFKNERSLYSSFSLMIRRKD